MAGDVAKNIDATRTGVEGAAYINHNGLKIVPTTRQYVHLLEENTPASDVVLSGKLVDRFDDYTYYAS